MKTALPIDCASRSAYPGLLLTLMLPTAPRRARPQLAAALSGAERGVPAGMRTSTTSSAAFDKAFVTDPTDLRNANLPPSSWKSSRLAAQKKLPELTDDGGSAIDGSSSSSSITAQSTTEAKLELSPQDSIARKELLREAFFPDWKDDASSSAGLEDPDEMQKKDPLATQIWKLYSKTKTQLPNQERMENLTWRMMAMSLKRKKREQHRCVSCLSAALPFPRIEAVD